MFNYDRIIQVLHQELGEAGLEAVTDSINYYLMLAGESDFGSAIDAVILYQLLYALNIAGFDYSLPDYSALKLLENRFK